MYELRCVHFGHFNVSTEHDSGDRFGHECKEIPINALDSIHEESIPKLG